jgi:type I restriction enzyme R subunit
MSKPGEHKTVQARILKYAKDIGWMFAPRAEAEQRRGFDRSAGSEQGSSASSPQEKARHASLFFGELLYEKVRRFNSLYNKAKGSLMGQETPQKTRKKCKD